MALKWNVLGTSFMILWLWEAEPHPCFTNPARTDPRHLPVEAVVSLLLLNTFKLIHKYVR
jgi:hypothetical protein